MTIQDSFGGGNLIKMIENFFENWHRDRNEGNRRYQSLTSNKFSRDYPTNPHLIKTILRGGFSPLIFLWGGSKETLTGEADQADLNALDSLTDIILRSSLVEMDLGRLDGGVIKTPRVSGPDFTPAILFCDSHHIYANGIPQNKCEKYFQTLKALVDNSKKRFKEQYWKNRLFKKERIVTGNSYDPRFRILRLGDILEEFEYYGLDDTPRYFDAKARAELLFENIEFLEKLAKKSEEHSLLKVSYGTKDIARFYAEFEIYFLRLVKEYSTKRFGGFDFRRGIFASFSDPEIQRPIAEAAGVPMLYLHSNCPQRGFNECPWYVDMPFEKQATK